MRYHVRAATRASPQAPARFKTWSATNYDLARTLTCGQAFRWQPHETGWTGVVSGRWVRLSGGGDRISAETACAQTTWDWLADYLQINLDLDAVLRTFPNDAPMRNAVSTCRGLRLLRQAPWECLASFILSSTKQIAQIQQVIARLCERFGDELAVPLGLPRAFAFPTPERLARTTEAALRECRMGFRAPYLLKAARAVADGKLDLARLGELELPEARARLQELNGVGAKIADCVLLFACGFAQAFPLDVWVQRALRQFYFAGRRVSAPALAEFAARHFGPHAGYAQQYLFHCIRTSANLPRTGPRLVLRPQQSLTRAKIPTQREARRIAARAAPRDGARSEPWLRCAPGLGNERSTTTQAAA